MYVSFLMRPFGRDCQKPQELVTYYHHKCYCNYDVLGSSKVSEGLEGLNTLGLKTPWTFLRPISAARPYRAGSGERVEGVGLGYII